MSPDDPRHGTYAGCVAHWRERSEACQPCAIAGYRYTKRRKYEAAHGQTRLVPSLGYVRRVQALQALGYPFTRIARLLGCSHGALSNRVYRGNRVSRVNLRDLDDLCNRIGYTPCPDPDTRTLNHASQKGWVPMAAWDDIDLDEAPSTGELSVGPRKSGPKPLDLDEFDYLVSAGESEHQAARQLGVTLAAVERAKFRAAARESAA